jgi:hypothetical protein
MAVLYLILMVLVLLAYSLAFFDRNLLGGQEMRSPTYTFTITIKKVVLLLLRFKQFRVAVVLIFMILFSFLAK